MCDEVRRKDPYLISAKRVSKGKARKRRESDLILGTKKDKANIAEKRGNKKRITTSEKKKKRMKSTDVEEKMKKRK